MKVKRKLQILAAMLGGGMMLGSGNCLPDDYWAGFFGDQLFDAARQLVEDGISDQVDGIDP